MPAACWIMAWIICPLLVELPPLGGMRLRSSVRGCSTRPVVLREQCTQGSIDIGDLVRGQVGLSYPTASLKRRYIELSRVLACELWRCKKEKKIQRGKWWDEVVVLREMWWCSAEQKKSESAPSFPSSSPVLCPRITRGPYTTGLKIKGKFWQHFTFAAIYQFYRRIAKYMTSMLWLIYSSLTVPPEVVHSAFFFWQVGQPFRL